MKNTKKAVLLAAALVAGGAVLGSAAYFAGHALTPLVGAAQEYERTFALAYENCTIVTNPSASNFGAITHVAPDGAVLEMQAAGPKGTVLPGDEAADTLTTMESGGIIYNTTYIREMAALRIIYGDGTIGKLTLSVSRDGKGWYEVGEMENNVTYGEWTYAPHYFKIEATGHVVLRGAFISANCGEDYAETIDHSLQGTYKGTLTVTDNAYSYASEETISDVTVIVEDDRVLYKTVAPESADEGAVILEDLILYPVGNDGFASTYYLAEDYNDPNPVEAATLGTEYSYLTVSYVNADGTIMVDFVGHEFVDAEEIKVSQAGEDITGQTINVGQGEEIRLEADVLPYDVTEDILWSVPDTSVVGFTYAGNKKEATGDKVTLMANGGGEATVTVACGSKSVTFKVNVEALAGEAVTAIPAELIGPHWSASTDYHELDVYFYDETTISMTDIYYYAFTNEFAALNAQMSYKEGNVYTLAFDTSSLEGYYDLVIKYDADAGIDTLEILSGTTSYDDDLTGVILTQSA